MAFQLCYYGNKILRKKCEEVKDFNDELRLFVKEMIETIDISPNRIGLAANQVGRLIRVFIIRPEVKTFSGEYVFSSCQVYINPSLSNPSTEKEISLEGCLSFPGLYGEVKRPLSVHLDAYDELGHPFSEDLSGFKARQVMHENDHLNGVLFIDRMEKEERSKIEQKLRQIKKKFR